MKTLELTGAALDWAVSAAQGDSDIHPYSTDWADGGPIIEREAITLDYDAHDTDKLWEARQYAFDGTLLQKEFGPTPLTAAMRCYVASKLGDTIDIPEELQ